MACDHVLRDRSQRFGRARQVSKLREGVLDQTSRICDGLLEAMNCDPGHLPPPLIATGCLAKLLGCGGDVEDVIHNLKREAGGGAVTAKSFEKSITAHSQSAHATGRLDQAGRLVEMNPAHTVCIQRSMFGNDVLILSACHTATSSGPGELQRQWPWAGRLCKQLKRDRQKAVTSEDCDRLAEGLMHRGASTTQIIVVHRWQVIMDQGVGVQAFDCNGWQRCLLASTTDGLGRCDTENRSQALTTSEQAVAQSSVQLLRPLLGSWQMTVHLGIDPFACALKIVLQVKHISNIAQSADQANPDIIRGATRPW